MADKEFIARNGIIANTTFVANSTVVQANGISVNSTGAYVTGTANAASHTVGSNFIANSTAIVGTGYANVTTSVNSALLTVGSSFIANTTGAYHTGTVNAASHTVGSSFIANTTGAYHTGTVNAASHTVGSSLIANTTGVYHTGTVNAASHTTTGVTANVTGVYPASNSSGTALGSTTNRWAITANSLVLSTALAIADGGTGATTAANARANLGVTATGSDTTYAYRANNLSDLSSASSARSNLGLGTIATQASSSVSITGGSITGITDLAIADGGTGASTAANARANLLGSIALGELGSYHIAYYSNNSTPGRGSIYSASDLTYPVTSCCCGTTYNSWGLSGTWRAISPVSGISGGTGVWLWVRVT